MTTPQTTSVSALKPLFSANFTPEKFENKAYGKLYAKAEEIASRIAIAMENGDGHCAVCYYDVKNNVDDFDTQREAVKIVVTQLKEKKFHTQYENRKDGVYNLLVSIDPIPAPMLLNDDY